MRIDLNAEQLLARMTPDQIATLDMYFLSDASLLLRPYDRVRVLDEFLALQRGRQANQLH